MPPATLTPVAHREMLNAARTIAKDSLSAARRLPDAVAAMAKRVGDFPMIGMERLDLAPRPYRIVAISGFPYVAIYDASFEPPMILRILHGAQDLQSILRDLPRQKR